jgi:deazaflavin-dependent oxidoreductase (nitroreductase family)
MGMDVLILHTVGRRSGQPRETPVAWFADGGNAWLVVASGGKTRHPDWHLNLTGHPDRASIELHPAVTRPPAIADRGLTRMSRWQVMLGIAR